MPTFQRKLYLTNPKGRDATVFFASLKAPPKTPRGLVGEEVEFKRFVGTSKDGTHEALQAAHGEDYADALIAGDPEIDLELIGREIGETSQVFLSSSGEVLHAPPRVVEVIFGPDGSERERKDPEDREANANDLVPVRWTGRRMKKEDAVRRFLFGRSHALTHQDGLTYDFLFEMAKDLHESGEMVMMGAGENGKEPLVLQTNGTPYRGFLEGRIDGSRYMLLLHLSNMELKKPEPAEKSADETEKVSS